MKSGKVVRASRVLVVGIVLAGSTGCEAVRQLVALPFDMAGHAAAEAARLPYDTAKMGAQGIVDAIASVVR